MGSGSSSLMSATTRIRPHPKLTIQCEPASPTPHAELMEDCEIDTSSSSGNDSLGEGDATVLFPLRKRQKASSSSNLQQKPLPQAQAVWRRELSVQELDNLWEFIVPTAHAAEFVVFQKFGIFVKIVSFWILGLWLARVWQIWSSTGQKTDTIT